MTLQGKDCCMVVAKSQWTYCGFVIGQISTVYVVNECVLLGCGPCDHLGEVSIVHERGEWGSGGK